MSTFKVGDIVYLNPKSFAQWKRDNNQWYKDYGFTLAEVSYLPLKIIEIKGIIKVEYKMKSGVGVRTWNLYPDNIVNYKPDNPILDKIKYLDQRFKDRKHVRVL